MTMCIIRNSVLLAVSVLGMAACGGGDSDEDDGGDDGNTNPNVLLSNAAFITSVAGSGDLSSWADAGGNAGLAAADSICQARAQAAGLEGTFVAWLSDSNNDAYCRVHGLSGQKSANCGQPMLPVAAGPWVRSDGFPFAAEIDQLTNNDVIFAPLRHDEFGTEIASGIPTGVFFTATEPDGTLDAFRTTCVDWTSAGSDIANAGSVDGTTRFWTAQFGLNCGFSYPLACFETGSGPDLPAFETTGKKVFVSSTGTDGALGGVTGGDAFCQQQADAAGLSGNYKAWLSDSTSNIVDRLVSDGPWVRLDGVKIADDKSDLTDGRLFTSISLNESGNRNPAGIVFTGANASGMALASHCQNWTSNDPTESAIRGSDALADEDWSGDNISFACNNALALYCFED